MTRTHAHARTTEKGLRTKDEGEVKQKAIIFIYCPDAHYGASVIIVVVVASDAATT